MSTCPKCDSARLVYCRGYPETRYEPGEDEHYECWDCGAWVVIDPYEEADTRGDMERERRKDESLMDW